MLFSDSDAASPRQIQTDNDASGNPQRVAGRPLGVPYGCGVPPRQTREMNAVCWSQVAGRKNNPNRGIRRGRLLTSQTAFGGQLPYKGSLVRPVARFHHIPFEYHGGLLRATSHEPRPFPRAEGYSRRCRLSELVAAQRHLTPRRPANCQLQPTGPSAPKFDERRTTYDERLFAWPSGPLSYKKNRRKFLFHYIHIFTVNCIYDILK